MTLFEAYQTEPEIKFTFGRNPLRLNVAKIGGGTLFKEYKGPWIMQLTDGAGNVIHETDKFEAFNVNHYSAARQYAWHISPMNELSTSQCFDLEEFAEGDPNFETL